MMQPNKKITLLLKRAVDEVILKNHLSKALLGKKKLRIKFGIDPTGENIHIGRAVTLWKLREFQNMGHHIILILGDYTAEVGDPSDKLEKRPFLTTEEINKNLKNYLPQIGKILDIKKTEVRRNSEWLSKLSFRETSRLADIFTIQQMLERKNFKDRLKTQKEISLRETLYPLMQGYDSVAIKADVELGGTDQLFNLLAGRKIQEYYGQKPQDIMTTKMLIGTDGRKMSTSWGNVINITDTPNDMYGKVMAMRDDTMAEYFELATDTDEKEIIKYKKEMAQGRNPKEVKEILASKIVERYHGEEEARDAGKKFNALFREKKYDTIPATKIIVPKKEIGNPTGSATVIKIALGVSKSEARRLMIQGGVRVNNEVKKEPNNTPPKEGDIYEIGKQKKRFAITIKK
jgi:tyrosyl-tRNA synthetase